MALRGFVIAGPTSVGKSELAVEVAGRLGGEIVGADGFQVYEGLELLTAKPSATQLARVPHHLIGEVPLSQSFDVAQYVALAERRIDEIRARGKVPLIVGGTGLYLRALMRGLSDLPPADEGLRAQLAARPLAEIAEELCARDAQAAECVDLKNPRRVIRALEVCLLSGRPFSSFREEWQSDQPGLWSGVVLTRDRDELYARIDARVEAMFSAGVVEEVAAARAPGKTAEQVLGWREIQALLAGKCSRAKCIAAIQQATRRYAKRQLTWFRREPALVPVDASSTDEVCRAYSSA